MQNRNRLKLNALTMRDNQKFGDFISTYLRIFEGTNDLDSKEAAIKMTAALNAPIATVDRSVSNKETVRACTLPCTHFQYLTCAWPPSDITAVKVPLLTTWVLWNTVQTLVYQAISHSVVPPPSFVESSSMPHQIIHSINKVSFTSNVQATGIVSLGPRKFKSIALQDLGSSLNVMDPAIAEALHLKRSSLNVPIEAEFANLQTALLTESVETTMRIGSYVTSIQFVICPIGHQIILGCPWFESIEVLKLTLSKQVFQFRQSNGPTISFPTLSPSSLIRERIKMGQQLDTMTRQAKQKSQQITKTRPIATITAKELEGIRKACKIYRIDIKEVTGEPTASLGKDATTITPGVLSLFPQIIQDLLRKYADRFEPPKIFELN
jgi:hypothetical protein